MKNLTCLDISENEVRDEGVTAIVQALQNSTIEELNLSGSGIGKSSKRNESGQALYAFMSDNRHLEQIKLNWNNLRGHVGQLVIRGLTTCQTIKRVELTNNLLGMDYENSEAPANFLAGFLNT